MNTQNATRYTPNKQGDTAAIEEQYRPHHSLCAEQTREWGHCVNLKYKEKGKNSRVEMLQYCRGERKLSFCQPWVLRGSGKSNICKVLVHDFTRQQGCPAAPRGAPWLLSTSCSQPHLEPPFAFKGEKKFGYFQNTAAGKGIRLQHCQILETWQKICKEFHKGFFLFDCHHLWAFLYVFKNIYNCRF